MKLEINLNEQSDIQSKIEKYFSEKDDIDTVLLFGSFANGTFTSYSDIDIAIHSFYKLDYDKLSKIQTDLALLCKREIDLVDLKKAEGIFLYQIMTTGKKIKIDNTIFVNHLVKALCFREDFLPIIKRSQEEKIRRFINGE